VARPAAYRPLPDIPTLSSAEAEIFVGEEINVITVPLFIVTLTSQEVLTAPLHLKIERLNFMSVCLASQQTACGHVTAHSRISYYLSPVVHRDLITTLNKVLIAKLTVVQLLKKFPIY
jgi:hypothetical protein